MNIYQQPPKTEWADLLKRPELEPGYLESSLKNILNRVKTGGDKTLIELAEKYDKSVITSIEVTQKEIEAAENSLSDTLKEAIKTAYSNIYTFHDSQRINENIVETMKGVRCWRRAVSIEKVGIYIPGGSAPLFSTVLMLAIPAVIAGCKEIVLCSPPSPNGNIHPAILFAARLSGITKMYKAGGAQAIAAMAYGTESVPSVYKIFGPGNQYVTYAKKLVSQEGIAIDMPAGPSEVAIIADNTSNPAFIASDLLSQAEHGPDSQVLLFTNDSNLAEAVQKEVASQLENLPRKEIAKQALSQSKIILLETREELIEITNQYAPEHLIIASDLWEVYSEKIINAGSVFVGNYTPEAAGDYASGTNHTLPTNGYARVSGGVSLGSFMKYITFQHISEQGLRNIGPVIETMAEAEELFGHKNAVTLRLNELKR